MRYLLCCLLAASGIALIQEKSPQENITKDISFAYNERMASFRSKDLAALSFGYSHLWSNLLWVRFLEDQNPFKKIPNHAVSWIYRDLDAVLDLDPDFYPAAECGGLYLSVVTEDRLGARDLMEKGILLFPQDWRIYAYLGYHYQFELKDFNQAARVYAIGAKQPGASFLLGVLAGHFIAKTDSVEAGIQFLQDLIQDTKDPNVRKPLEDKLRKLQEKKHE